MTDKQKIAFASFLTKHVKSLSDQRDALRETMAEYEDILIDADEGIQELEHALDIISQRI